MSFEGYLATRFSRARSSRREFDSLVQVADKPGQLIPDFGR